MKRSSEKTFGPSPESATSSKRTKRNNRPSHDPFGGETAEDRSSHAHTLSDEESDTKKAFEKAQKSTSHKKKGIEAEGKIVVAVDFGTTYSGLAWAQTKIPETHWIINQWPDSVTSGIEGRSNDKVPTELQYGSDGLNWGYQIPSGALRLQWFKLGLCPDAIKEDASLTADYPNDKAATPAHGQTPELLVKDYLSALRKHVEVFLEKKLPASVLSTTKIEYVITVPAMWSEAAVSMTRKCAEGAGMGEDKALQVVTEPEAAAVYALREIASYGLNEGDTFVVCDAGGGTVDLITYRISKLSHPLRVVEIVAPRGEKCGSVLLNRAFEKFLRGKLGEHRAWNEDMMEEALKRFESEVKRLFTGSKEKDFQIPVPAFPDSRAHDVLRTRFRLKGSDLFNIFEPIVGKITKLVIEQIIEAEAAKFKVKAILMVGGFGENGYLNQRLKEAVSDRDITIWSPAHGWTAVVRGALMRGLAEVCPKSTTVGISGRFARCNYGTESAKEFDEKLHPVAQRVWSSVNNRYEVNTFDWFIEKADTLTEKKPIRLSYHTERLTKIATLDPVQITIVKYINFSDEDPPLFVGDSQVKNLATIQVPLDRINTKGLKKRRAEDGQQYYIIDFSLRVTCHSAEMIYELVHRKRSYGRVVLEYS